MHQNTNNIYFSFIYAGQILIKGNRKKYINLDRCNTFQPIFLTVEKQVIIY